MQARLSLVLCFLAILLGYRHPDIASAPAEIDPAAEACARWHKHHSFDDLRSCCLSVVHSGEHKARVVAMLGPGQRVTVSHRVWNRPREAYSYTPADKPNFHYVAVYQDDIVVEQCSYSLNSAGEAEVVMP